MSWSASPALALLASFVEQRAGMSYSMDDRSLFADKARARASEAGFESCLDYYYLLRYDDPEGTELAALTEALAVNETYLFRELAPLEVIADEILPPIVRGGGRPRVWSAACSTGEEPATLAMVLAARGLRSSVDILASDISARALGRAKRSEHGIRAIRQTPPALYSPYIVMDGSRPRVRRDVLGDIEFRQLNLCDAAAIRSLGVFDVILCRNVFIYFRDARIVEIIDSLAAALVPGGIVLVSSSESLLRLSTSLVCEERAGCFFYRKPR